MYAFIKGKLFNKNENLAVIDCNGVGYELNISQSTLADLPQIGEEVLLHTYLIVREDEMLLCGFSKMEEKQMFLKLISVSGIGSKTALAILSCVNYQDLQNAIYSQDANFIAKIKGVGKKTAERIIVELKDKVSSAIDLFTPITVTGADSEFTQDKQDATQALISLGIQKTEATRIVNKVATFGDSCETIIAKALKYR